MKATRRVRSGFSWDEALFLARLAKEVHWAFQCKPEPDREGIRALYHLLYPQQKMEPVHIIGNDDARVQGLILKHPDYHLYSIVLKAVAVVEAGAQWELIPYSEMASPQAQVSRRFLSLYRSVASQIDIFFKTLVGQLTLQDFQHLKHLSTPQRLACLEAIADAGVVRLGTSFDLQIRDLIFHGVIHQGISDPLDHEDDSEQSNPLTQSLIELDPVAPNLEVYVTGHGSGGCFANICALELRRSTHLNLKVYTFGAPKLGNRAFADVYKKEMGDSMSHRIENWLDYVPHLPLSTPFFMELNPSVSYAAVGEVHIILGLGVQDRDGSFDLWQELPSPHSFDTYIQLLEIQYQIWIDLLRPVRSVIADLMSELTQAQDAELIGNLQSQVTSLKHSLDELSEQIQGLHHQGSDELMVSNAQEGILQEAIMMALPGLRSELLAKVIANAQPLVYLPGAAIVRQGDHASSFYIIAQGHVEVVLEDVTYPPQVVGEMGPGEYFGEIGLLSGGIRTATVRSAAEGPVQVLAIDQATFKLMLSESEITATQIAYSMASRGLSYPDEGIGKIGHQG